MLTTTQPYNPIVYVYLGSWVQQMLQLVLQNAAVSHRIKQICFDLITFVSNIFNPFVLGCHHFNNAWKGFEREMSPSWNGNVPLMLHLYMCVKGLQLKRRSCVHRVDASCPHFHLVVFLIHLLLQLRLWIEAALICPCTGGMLRVPASCSDPATSVWLDFWHQL